MIIERLTLGDFRAYSGVHEIALRPRERKGLECPIILFGGLNGAGKTTILLALKLALYGRLALGAGTSKAHYTKFIRSCIHRVPGAMVQRNSAFIDLEFIHGKLGRQAQYKVRRGWYDDGREIRETVSLCESGERKKALTPQAVQGFLNELVPVGVSELFFFDGEKIADLAEDDSGSALGDAIHRLLGIDTVERLRNDLRVYLLRRESKAGCSNASKELEKLQNEQESTIHEIAQDRAHLEQAQSKLDELTTEKDLLEIKLSERGGEWGHSREFQQAKAKELAESLKRDERELREAFSGAYPLSLASSATSECVELAASALVALNATEANQLLEKFANSLKQTISKREHPAIDKLLSESLHITNGGAAGFDLSHRSVGRIEHTLEAAIPESQAKVKNLTERIQSTKDDLDQIALQIQQAPDEASLASVFSELATLNEQIAEATADIAVREGEIKAKYANAIGMARTLRDKHHALSEQIELQQPIKYATGARELLREFGQVSAERKLDQLENEFALAFRRLARKDDMVSGARIDSRRFTVKILDRDGVEIEKSKLSAGERQIYAIAMLEALARTSGRRLPVVIDTPLGRLDSHHRTNLVRDYFPRISHQVILLSTDTEVDEGFYRELSPHISHAFEICYCEHDRKAHLKEGYFWRKKQRANA
ncbi:MAG: DNA sulfur modification protein DndD [Gammaproteobacteria bacterium]|nr:DNA sulfur modification protein DndD [Gammaproteobacteria bacterium]